MVEFLHVKRREKRNRTDFYQGIVKVCVGGIQYGATETFCLLKYFSILGSRFAKILKYSKCLSIIFMLNWFKHFDPKKKTVNFLSKKMFQYPQTKICPKEQDVAILPYFILLTSSKTGTWIQTLDLEKYRLPKNRTYFKD